MEREERPLPPTGHGNGMRPRGRCGAGRIFFYFVLLLALNAALAIFALYMLGMALSYDWTTLQSGAAKEILDAAFQLLLLFSPVILTFLLNRLLFRVFGGRRHFPRGMGWLAALVAVLTQAAVVFLICKYGMIDLPLATPLIIESGVVGG